MRHDPIDRNGNPIVIGDRVVLFDIPSGLLEGLLKEDQIAIRAQQGMILIVEDFDSDGLVELEFVDDADGIHTIWIKPQCLERV